MNVCLNVRVLFFRESNRYTDRAMADILTHPAGSFCWSELNTNDQNAAKRFYSSLFGWSVTDYPAGPDGVYTIFRINDRNAAAADTANEEERKNHFHPHWKLYIATDSADAAAARADAAGGKVLAPPFDVMDIGRMTVVQDPTGASVCLWQATKQGGFGVVVEDGAFCRAELNTPDALRAGKFYSDTVGWKLEKAKEDSSGYFHIKNGEKRIGGIPSGEHRAAGAPVGWMVYFQVADVDASTEKARQMGARIYEPPRKIAGVGIGSVLADPQGAVFALFKADR
jgi:predicted enzyme related to lactoylglutathione lyase